jgi:integrase
MTPEQDRQAEAITDLEEALERQRERDWAAYGEALKAQVEAAAAKTEWADRAGRRRRRPRNLPGAAGRDLRHRYTTVLHDAGVPQRTIDYVVGHAPIGTTLAVYVEVTPESLGKVRAVLEDAWSSAVEQAMTQFSRISEDAAGS